MELAARTLVKLGQLPGSKGVESFEYDIKQAFEFISEERNEVSFRKGEITCKNSRILMYLQTSYFPLVLDVYIGL